MEKILERLIAYPSVTGNLGAAEAMLGYVQSYLEDRGMYTKQHEQNGYPSLVATTQPDTKKPAVLLVVHIDVVPTTDDEHVLTKKDGKYLGRGVYDMKFALAIYMQLVDELKNDLQTYDFGIMVTSDEEVGGMDGVSFLLSKGYRPEVCVIPDGGDNWQIEEFAKGIHWVKIEASGISSHASRPWEGDHAIHKLLEALGDIRALFPEKPAKEESLVSVGTIEGGSAINQVPDYAATVLDIRYGSMADYEQFYPRIRKICQKHDVESTLLIDDPPCTNHPMDPYILKFAVIMKDILGYDPGSSFSYAATDGRHFSRLGIPCIIVEPPGGGRHSDHEWISIEGCKQFHQMLKQYLQTAARSKTIHANPVIVETVAAKA